MGFENEIHSTLQKSLYQNYWLIMNNTHFTLFSQKKNSQIYLYITQASQSAVSNSKQHKFTFIITLINSIFIYLLAYNAPKNLSHSPMASNTHLLTCDTHSSFFLPKCMNALLFAYDNTSHDTPPNNWPQLRACGRRPIDPLPCDCSALCHFNNLLPPPVN